MDPRAALARRYHRDAYKAAEQAGQCRAQRDQLIRALRAEDPGIWTYAALAAAIGCSPELIAYVIKNEPSPR